MITPEDLPMVFPAASTPALRQLPPVQLNDQLWASASKHKEVQMMTRMRRNAFFMSSITSIVPDFPQEFKAQPHYLYGEEY